MAVVGLFRFVLSEDMKRMRKKKIAYELTIELAASGTLCRIKRLLTNTSTLEFKSYILLMSPMYEEIDIRLF